MQKKYCAAPWRGLHINPRGDVKTCCAGDPNMLGNLNNSTMEDVLHSTRMIEIRESIKQGHLHSEYCANCIKTERYGRSERDWHNNVNTDFDISSADVHDHKPSIVDVRWNTTCNLTCNYCGPYCSSRWAAVMKLEYQSGARPYYLQVTDYLRANAQHVREVALVGGEPLLLPENETLLDVIPEGCLVTLITNMNVDFDRNLIVQKLSQRHQVGWNMSLDNIGSRFEYVRYHGLWDLTAANVHRVAAWIRTQGHSGGIHAVYNLYNCTRLLELREWTDYVGVKIHWQTLHQPEYLDPALHNSAVRQAAIDEIQRYRSRFALARDEHAFFSLVEQRLNSTDQASPQTDQFWCHISDTETKYHGSRDTKKFAELWPELKAII